MFRLRHSDRCTYERIGNTSIELISRLGIMHTGTNVRDEFDKLWGTTNVMTSIMYEINILLLYNILYMIVIHYAGINIYYLPATFYSVSCADHATFKFYHTCILYEGLS